MIWHNALEGIACALFLTANRINAKRLTIGYIAADSISMATALKDRPPVRSEETARETDHNLKAMRQVTNRFVRKLNENKRGTEMSMERVKVSSFAFRLSRSLVTINPVMKVAIIDAIGPAMIHQLRDQITKQRYITRPSPTRILTAETVFRKRLIGALSLAKYAAGPPGRSANVINASIKVLMEAATCIVPSVKRTQVRAKMALLTGELGRAVK